MVIYIKKKTLLSASNKYMFPPILQARMSSPALKAGTLEKVTDFNNSTVLSASLCSGRAKSPCVSYSSTPVKRCLLSGGQGTKAMMELRSLVNLLMALPKSSRT
jgi:hypothetical protein